MARRPAWRGRDSVERYKERLERQGTLREEKNYDPFQGPRSFGRVESAVSPATAIP